MTNKVRITDEVIMAYIKAYVQKKGYGPSIRDLGRGVGFHSTSATALRVKKLRQRGQLVKAPKGSSRTIFPVPHL